MKVTVKLGAPLSQVTGENKAILVLPETATVADALRELGSRYPDFEAGLKGKGLRKPFTQVVYSLFLDARPVQWDKTEEIPLYDGARLYLFLPVAGG